MDTTSKAIRDLLAEVLQRGKRVKALARDGQHLSAEQLPRAREVPPCYLLRIGTDRLIRREVFTEALAAAARLLELGTPERLQAALAER